MFNESNNMHPQAKISPCATVYIMLIGDDRELLGVLVGYFCIVFFVTQQRLRRISKALKEYQIVISYYDVTVSQFLFSTKKMPKNNFTNEML